MMRKRYQVNIYKLFILYISCSFLFASCGSSSKTSTPINKNKGAGSSGYALLSRGSSNKASSASAAASQASDEDHSSKLNSDTEQSDSESTASSVSDGVQPLYQQLSREIQSADWRKAQQTSLEILKLVDKDPIATNALAMVYYRMGRIRAARLLLEKLAVSIAAKSNSGGASNSNINFNASVQNNLALLDIAEGEEADALLKFKNAYKERGGDTQAAVAGNLGSMMLQGGEAQRSLSLLKLGYSEKKSEAPLAINYAVSLRANQKLSDAADVYEDILKNDPRNVAALLNLAILDINYRNRTKDGLELLTKLKFSQNYKKEITDKINELEKKARDKESSGVN